MPDSLPLSKMKIFNRDKKKGKYSPESVLMNNLQRLEQENAEMTLNMISLISITEALTQILVEKGITTREEYNENLKIAMSKFGLKKKDDTSEENQESVEEVFEEEKEFETAKEDANG